MQRFGLSSNMGRTVATRKLQQVLFPEEPNSFHAVLVPVQRNGLFTKKP